MNETRDTIVILGAGMVGLSIARQIKKIRKSAKIFIIEKKVQ